MSLRDCVTYEGDAVGGYAPGNYMCRCFVCQVQFWGDKRAFMCRPCAVERFNRQRLIVDAAAAFQSPAEPEPPAQAAETVDDAPGSAP